MIPGHTQFAPDVFFPKIAKAFYAADVFNEAELKLIAEQFGVVTLDNRGIVRTWREVGEKYTSLPGIRELHDFVTVAMPPDKVVMKVHARCYAGALRDTTNPAFLGSVTHTRLEILSNQSNPYTPKYSKVVKMECVAQF